MGHEPIQDLTCWFASLPTPEPVQSDNGTHVHTVLVKERTKLNGVCWPCAWVPQANEMVERANRLLKQQLHVKNARWARDSFQKPEPAT